ncbi:MAG: hypothetical protein HRT47_02910 [Candidatus Caenarcaniphilales bacterium]|nr:hypothetical protein [Candidatus Caenarcaniphilales bacterium]
MKKLKTLFTSTLNEEIKEECTKQHNLFVNTSKFNKKELKRTNLKMLLSKLKDYSGIENREKAGK